MSQPKSVIERSLFSLTWPIFIDTLFVFLINVVDAWFLSRISDTAAAAVGAVLPIAAMCFTFFIALNMAGCAVASRKIGARDLTNLDEVYGTLMWLCLLVGGVIATILLSFGDLSAELMGLTGEAAAIGGLYLHTLGYGVLFLALRFGASAILQSQGQTQWNMICTGLMTIVNLVFNYLLIDGKFGFPSWGVKGIAIATCLSWSSNLAFSLWAIIGRIKLPVRFLLDYSQFKKWTGQIFSIALPTTLEPLSWHFSQLVIISMVVSLGDLALATRVYAFNLIFVVVLFTTALSAGVQLKVAHLYGAKEYIHMSRELYKGVFVGLITITLMVGLLYTCAASMLGLFTQNPEIILLGTTIIGLAIMCEVGRLLNMLIGASLKITGFAKFITVFGVSTMWLISVPLAWLLGIHWAYGLAGIWVAMGIDELLRGVIAMSYWNSRQRQRIESGI